MCVIAFAWDVSPRFRVALIGNRDEFYARPSAAAAPWPDKPGIVGGRDLEEGGTWLAVAPGRGAAAVTNVRGAAGAERPRSRGALPVDFLADPAEFAGLENEAFAAHRPFNFLGFTPDRAIYRSNAPGGDARDLQPGLHHLSNGALDAPWPKSLRLRDALTAWLARDTPDDVEPLLAALADTALPPDAALPDTGIGLAQERALATPFIATPHYGTRTSSVLLLDQAFRGVLIERPYAHGERCAPDNRVAL